MGRPAPRTLAWRLYAVGFVQLILLAGAVVGVGHLIAPEHGPPPMTDGPPGGHGTPPHHGPPSPVGPLLTFFLSGIVIVGVGSVLTARWIVSPLETLSKSARALGRGDLRTRTGLTRNDELGEVGRAFDEMAERVESLLLAERELLANVSHELRTPLARIRVALDLAGEAGSPEDGRASLGEIQSDLAEIETLIDDILTAARLEIEGGRAPTAGFELHVEPVAPETVCERAASRFRTRHPRRRLEVYSGGGLPAIEADPMLLRRALDNLLDNADKYSPDADAPVVLRATARFGKVTFEVIDAGVGIEPHDLPRVFTPFFRGDRSRSRGTGGVGLGLTLAKRIVVAHAGTIALESAVGSGTTVRVVLPASPDAG
ncbi:MAG TPA: HAMP domain-containing sensor histidine kinase [Polyangiaceae bacterium]|jgi:signal transduction histidine kinase